MDKERLIVRIIGCYLIVVGIINLMVSLVSLSSASGKVDVLAPIGIVAGVGILKLKNWSRMLGILLNLIGLVISIWLIFVPGSQVFIAVLFILISGAIIYFLSLPAVKEQFK